MPSFTSKRERRLWLWTAVVVLAIFTSLGLTPGLVAFLSERGLVEPAFGLGALLVLAAILSQGLRVRPRGAEIGVALGVAAAYLLVFVRLSIPAAERTHLVEYGVVAVLVHEALAERARHGGALRWPVPLLALAITSCLGVLDEAVQWLLPNRVFDWRDIAFNVVAAWIAVVGMTVLGWVRGHALGLDDRGARDRSQLPGELMDHPSTPKDEEDEP